MLRLAALVAALCVAGGVAAAQASGPPPVRSGHAYGIVPSKHFASGVQGAGQLRYHSGGRIMPTNTTYAVYWIPPGYSVSANYRPLIDQFLGDVAADSGKTSNVYYSDTQYYQTIGGVTTHVSYSSSFAGSVVDTDPLPASGCSDSYTSVCLTDAQLQTELQKVMAGQGWTGGSTKLYFLFTAKGIGSCSGTSCAFSNYCAYHSWIGSGTTATVYANQPYADTVPAACDAGQRPNGDDADATINVASHEHNESITDEQGNAWYDMAGYENGDKCAWNFGAQLGSTAYGQYNQLINGHPYELQQEYSNARRNCVLTGT